MCEHPDVGSGSATVTVPGSGEITLPGAGAHTVSFRMYIDAGCASGEFSATHTINPAIAPRTSNPNLAGSCGQMNVVLILDESSSITNNAAFVTNVKDAAKAFVNGLKGTGTNLAVVEFDETATKPLGAAYVPISDPVPAAWTNYIDNEYGSNSFWSKGAYTNWQDALVKTTEFDVVKNADLVVFITDGDPTAYGVSPAAITTGEPDGYNTGLKPAFDLANGLKAGGSHLFMVGVGAAVGADADAPNKKLRMKGISDDEELLADASNIKTADVTFVTDFAKLQAQLALIATELCRSQVTVLKQVDDGQGYLPVSGSKPGWDFTAGVTVNTGTFAFDPGAGPGPLTTTAAGATFQWKPSSLVATSDVTITETAQANYAMKSVSCTNGITATPNLAAGSFFIDNLPYKGNTTCTVKNQRNTGTIQLKKEFIAGPASQRANLFIKQGGNPIAGGSAPNVASGGGTAVLTVPTGNFDISETGGTARRYTDRPRSLRADLGLHQEWRGVQAQHGRLDRHGRGRNRREHRLHLPQRVRRSEADGCEGGDGLVLLEGRGCCALHDQGDEHGQRDVDERAGDGSEGDEPRVYAVGSGCVVGGWC